jgi:hypothetical protein
MFFNSLSSKPFILLVCIFVSAALGEDAIPVTHWEFQAINQDGSSAFTNDPNAPLQVVLEGILLNNPEDWLSPEPDSTPGPWQMGGEWEIFIQGEGDDLAGTACWMGQNYGNGLGDDNYTDQQWLDEISRLNRDPQSGWVFHAGDRIRVTGTYLFYAGKLNINENHQTDSKFNFKVELVKPAVGVPRPESLTISDLKNPDNSEKFDSTRMTGGERYQSRLVRLEGVTIDDPENWGNDSTITVSDDGGLTFPVHLALGSGIAQHECPSGKIDVVGVLNQVGPGYPQDPTKGYYIIVMDYDGNGKVLGAARTRRGNLSGDINSDYIVNLQDIAEIAAGWLETRSGLYQE